MKTILTVVFLFVSLVSFGQTDSIKNSKVYILRSTGHMASLTKFKIFLDSSRVCKIGNNKILTLEVTPGQHSFAIQANGKALSKHAKAITLFIEPGKDYYLLTDLRSKASGNYIYLNTVSLSGGLPEIPKLKKVACKY